MDPDYHNWSPRACLEHVRILGRVIARKSRGGGRRRGELIAAINDGGSRRAKRSRAVSPARSRIWSGFDDRDRSIVVGR